MWPCSVCLPCHGRVGVRGRVSECVSVSVQLHATVCACVCAGMGTATWAGPPPSSRPSLSFSCHPLQHHQASPDLPPHPSKAPKARRHLSSAQPPTPSLAHAAACPTVYYVWALSPPPPSPSLSSSSAG